MALSHHKLRNPVAKMALSSAAAGALVVGGAGMAQACTGSSSGGTRDAGTVQSVNGNVITLTDQAGSTDTVDTNSNTVYESQGGGPVANGDFLVAWGTTQSDGSLLASKVRYGPAGSQSSFESGSSPRAQQSSYAHNPGSSYGDSDQDHHDYRR